ncbi:unnamed protein product [Oikopleura dioica]|uniref:Uncharacterized protein n=1 Tax=Oikopleura dioica TaxID=34765 RepID=E4WUD3_OIKDI|nr:unnamed protein product [Oikopleura dioica]
MGSLSPFKDLESQDTSLGRYDSSDESIEDRQNRRRTTISFGQNQLKEYVPEVELFCFCFKEEEDAKNFQFILIIVGIFAVGLILYFTLLS